MDYSYIRTNSELRGLHPLFNAWFEVLRQYSAALDDVPWWYGELANISCLVAAASKAGWIALQEYRTTKAGDRLGRCDLYLAHGSQSFAIEAKIAFQPISPRTEDRFGVARQKMQEAWDDAGDLQNGEADKRLALTFLVPHVPANSDKDKLVEWLESWTQELCNLSDADALAWHFVPMSKLPNREIRFREDYTSDKLFPGVAVLISERKRGRT